MSSSSSVVSNLTKQLLDQVLMEIKKEENKIRIKKEVLDPIITYSVGQIYPYMIMTVAIFILTFLLALIILIVLIRK